VSEAGGTHYRATGEGAPLVLVHGVGLDLEIWEPMVPLLQQGRRILRYDMLGHGGSAKPPGPYRLADFALQLARLSDALGLERFDLAGFSLGGLVAEAFAARFGDRLRRLALLNVVHDRSPAERAAVEARLARVEAGELEVSIAAALERWFTPGFAAARPEVVAAIGRRMRGNDPAAYLASYRVFATADPELPPLVASIRCPTLVLTAENDVGSTPAMSRALAARLPEARLAILPHLRHLALVEAPAKVAAHLSDFLEG